MKKHSKARKSKGCGETPRRLSAMAKRDGAALLELLDRMEDRRSAYLLLMRHGLNMSWPSICEAAERHGLYYSARHFFRLYARALRQAEALEEARHEG